MIELDKNEENGKKKKVEELGNLGLGNLKFFGVDFNELLKSLSGHTLEEFAKNPKLAEELKEKLQKTNPNTVSSEKKVGDVTFSTRVTRREIVPEGTDGRKVVRPPKAKSKKETEEEIANKEEEDRKWKEEEDKLFKDKE